VKKILCLILALFTVLCFAACGGSTTPTPDNGGSQSSNAPVAATDGYVFNYNGTKIAMHADAAPIIAALGEPKSCTEEASCAFTGLDKTYFYGSFYIQTYPVGDKDYVFGVWFADDSVTTDEGVYVGMTQADVEAAYGAESFNGTNAYVMTKGKSTLTVILTDGAVSSIQYDAVVE
jgi:hypothetical protein